MTHFLNACARSVCGMVLCLLICAFQVKARDLQLLLIPEPAATPLGEPAPIADIIPTNYISVEKGLALSLSTSLEILIDKHRIFSACKLYLCGEQDISSLLQKVIINAPDINLLVLYSFGGEAGSTVYVRLLDPHSYRVRFSDNLSLIDEVNETNLLALGQDMGRIIEANLRSLKSQYKFILQFDGFLNEELKGLSTSVIATGSNSELALTESNLRHLLFDMFFAINNNQYTLVSTLNAEQLKQLLVDVFEQQGLDISLSFTQENNKVAYFYITRDGNPYTAKLLIGSVFIAILLLTILWYYRRRYFDLHLTEYAAQRDADSWLRTYKKASFVLYGLRNKWMLQTSIWTQRQKESTELVSQANLYFEAGDLQSTKLFLTKALHYNSANTQATILKSALEEAEINEKTLSANEQLIKDKLEEAMASYHQNEAINALRCLYQAVAVTQNEASLSKQMTALNLLIAKIKQEFSVSEQSLLISCSSAPQRVVLCQNETIHIGRQTHDEGVAWISANDSVFYINHNVVSRAGKQCFIKRQNDGFFLVDSDSKNGTLVKRKKLVPHQPERLDNADIIYLGGSSPTISSALVASLSPNHSLLALSIDMQAMTLLDKQALNKVWPDNAIAVRSKLVCMHEECFLALNIINHEIYVLEIEELEKINRNTDKQSLSNNTLPWQPLCIVKLGNAASIRPLDFTLDDNEILLDSKPLLGEVPLILPCTIRYSTTSITFTTYDYTKIGRNNSPLGSISTIAGKQ